MIHDSAFFPAEQDPEPPKPDWGKRAEKVHQLLGGEPLQAFGGSEEPRAKKIIPKASPDMRGFRKSS